MSDQNDLMDTAAIQSLFGAQMEVGIQLRATVTDLELMKSRARTKLQVRTCKKCSLVEKCAGPVPMRGPITGGAAKVTVIGEAPGKQEDSAGVPFVGASGKLLKAMMMQTGFDLEETAWCNTVSCWPRREPPTPKREEMMACRGNLRDQVISSGATYCLLVGGIATQAWRSDLKVSDVHGRVFLWGGMWIVMPIFHPAAILRDQTKKKPTIDDLAKFSQVVKDDAGLTALEGKCVKCGEYVNHYDPDGVAWCERHWLRYGNQWREELERWNNDRVVKVKRGHGKRATVLIEGQRVLG